VSVSVAVAVTVTASVTVSVLDTVQGSGARGTLDRKPRFGSNRLVFEGWWMPDRYFLIEVDGDEAFLRGYVEGYFRARGVDVAEVFFGSDFGLDDERFLTRIEAFFGIKVEHNLLVVPEGFRQHFEEAISRLPSRWGIRMTGAREVRAIRYPFRAATNNRDVANEIRSRLHDLPPGAALEPFREQETVRDETFETSAYAPEHPYRYEVEGTLTGEVAATLRAYASLAPIEAVSFEEPRFDFA